MPVLIATEYSRKKAKSLRRLLTFFVWIIRKDIRHHIPAQSYSRTKAEICAEFEGILPEIPQAAPDGDRLQGPVDFMFVVVAVRAVFKAHGVPVPVLGKAIEAGIERLLGNPIIKYLFKRAGKKLFSKGNRKILQNFGKLSQENTYPLGFAFEWEHKPESEWKDHYTILECGICKVGKKYDASDIVPYLCRLDDLTFAARGQRMHRTTTIASGATHCDFKFRPEDR